MYIFKTISYPAFIKVGFSHNSPDKRLRSIQTGCPYKVEILIVKEGASALEGMLHGHLKEFRVQGEWFIFSPECEKKVYEFFNINKPRTVKLGTLENRRSPRRVPNIKLHNKIIELCESGATIRSIAKELGINNCTVLRHKNEYSQRYASKKQAPPAPESNYST